MVDDEVKNLPTQQQIQHHIKTRYEREQELISSGLVDEIKKRFRYNSSISDEYYMLITDYIDCLNEVNDSLHIDAVQIVNALPQLITSIKEIDLGGVHGRTDEHDITMNSKLDYEQKKLYFFHEMTHAIQTTKINGREICSFYNGNDGMFLTEGATQYTAEILYHVSNGTNIDYKEQRGVVRGQSEHRTYSPLSEYQLNGNMIQLLSKTINLPIPDILAMGYRKDGREILKQWYETYENNAISFDELMSNLEKIYDIDKLVIAGYSSQLSGEPVNIQRQNGQTFKGNLQLENDLIIQTERDLMASFIGNHDENYIFQNYEEFCASLTTPKLRVEFLGAVKELQEFVKQNGMQNENDMTLRKTLGFANMNYMSIVLIIITILIAVFIIIKMF